VIPGLIYVVDDEEVTREGVALALKREYQVETFPTAEAAFKALEKDSPDLILLDVGLPGMNGIEALKEIKKLYPEILIIMITAYEDIATVVSAMKLGAYDYVAKPFHMDALIVNVRNALETISMRKEIKALQKNYLKENLPCFIGDSDAIQDVMEVVRKVAQSPDTSVLILGETGTGKELIAKAIHYRSPCFKGPLVTVNCAAIPKELIESELFGYEKGAFSGAVSSGKIGFVEKAENGTLFLDEVGDLSMEAQAKLLRFLEKGEFYRVGGTSKKHVRTRIISATNRNLERMIENDGFRKDLYYRLAVVKIEVPSLNQRRHDIISIAKYFLLEFSRKFGKNFVGISPQAERALKEFHWKGNVRELRNVMERAVLIGEGSVLTPQHIGLEGAYRDEVTDEGDRETKLPPLARSGINYPSIMHSIERHYFEEALTMAKGNESKAARLLLLSRDTFRYRKNKLHAMEKPYMQLTRISWTQPAE
jgi:DNA-binding NtrC family response regulator